MREIKKVKVSDGVYDVTLNGWNVARVRKDGQRVKIIDFQTAEAFYADTPAESEQILKRIINSAARDVSYTQVRHA